MDAETVRAKARDGSPVMWGSLYGEVRRVARDLSWADIQWYNCFADYRDCIGGWSKRQPLTASFLRDLVHGLS